MAALSPKKKRVLDYINAYVAKHGISPTTREIREKLKLQSDGTVSWYVKELVKEGYLQRTGSYSSKRALSVVKDEEKYGLPLLGVITAGYPLQVFENKEMIEAPSSYLGADHFVLLVSGNSMLEDNIQHGDYIIIKQTGHADPGQVVVAYLNGEATLKRYFPQKDHIELRPSNKEFSSIIVNPTDDFRIGGVVLYSFRKYQ